MTRLTEKVAVITGAGGGIGQAMALRLAQEGAHVIAADVTQELADTTAYQVAALGRQRSLSGSMSISCMAYTRTLGRPQKGQCAGNA